MLDKNSFMGGNSTKATSGINGALTRQQQRLGIKDSVDAFLKVSTSVSIQHLTALNRVLKPGHR